MYGGSGRWVLQSVAVTAAEAEQELSELIRALTSQDPPAQIVREGQPVVQELYTGSIDHTMAAEHTNRTYEYSYVHGFFTTNYRLK